MKITKAEFVMSNSDIEKCPDTGLLEYAFIGRSNVGKSSLINMLTGNKKLAMTSSTPGKTLLINHFIINEQWYLVDLPGYGYALQGKKGKQALKKIINSYICKREALTALFLLIDSRHEPQKIDLEFIQFLGEEGVPFSIVFTKTDKLKKEVLKRNIDHYKKSLLETWEELPRIFLTSSEKKIGKQEVLDYINEINLEQNNNK